MTGAGENGEPLRVPPWLGDAPDGDAPDQPLIPDPLPAPAAEEPLIAEPEEPAPDPAVAQGRRRMTVLLVAAGLVVAAVLGFGALRDGDRPDDLGAGVVRRSATPTGHPVIEPPSPVPSLEASPSVAATSPSRARPTTGAPTPSAVRFGPVTIEAEAAGNTVGGSAFVAQYPGASGGKVVRNVGDWGAREGDGVLRFEGVTVPVAGTYTLRLFHVNLDNEAVRTVVVTVDSGAPRAFTLAGNSTCCTQSVLRVELRQGRNTIVFGNPDGHAPSIDRIVLSLP